MTAQRESDLFITSMITDRIGQHEVLLPINHINYNFPEKNNQVMKEREICIKIPTKEMQNLLPVIRHQKHKSKRAHADTFIITTLNVIG